MIEVVCGRLKGAKVFADLDMNKGYWQFPVDEESQEILAIQTDRGVYQPTRILQGAKNGVSYFQSGITEALSDSQEVEQHSIVWLDNVLVYAETAEQLLLLLEAIFDICNLRKIRLSLKKCYLFKKQLIWNGKEISEEGIKPDPSKVQALVDMPSPRTAADLMQFLCAMNWMRTSLVNYTRTIFPLQELLEQALKLTKKRTKKEAAKIDLHIHGWWNSEMETTFLACKQMLINAVTLVHPDPEKEFCLFTDASKHSWASVLTQIPTEDIDLPFDQQRH